MAHPGNVTFHEALELVESLPDAQQDDLIDILRRRRLERRREALARNVESARRELERGEVRRGGVEDLLRELEA